MSATYEVKLSNSKWQSIRRQLKEDYPPSVLLIRDSMKRELGFTTRLKQFNAKSDDISEIYCLDGEVIREYNWFIVLDFFDEQKQMLFKLKYL